MDREEARKELHRIDAETIQKQWIQEKCNTNTPPTSVPEHPSKGNCKCNCHKKQKRKDKYKDIIEFVKLYVQAYYRYMQPDTTIEEMKPLNDALDKWLEEEV